MADKDVVAKPEAKVEKPAAVEPEHKLTDAELDQVVGGVTKLRPWMGKA